jgi:L-seryl-tRNA(Ser) seleniumtransferase
MTRTEDGRRRVPRTDTVLGDARLAAPLRELGRDVVKGAVHAAQEQVRTGDLPAEDVLDQVLRTLPATAASLHAVINATGVVLHTNLGRAPLSAAAVDALEAAAGYVDVEFDLATGRRATRGQGALRALRGRVPAGEDALIVNNGAAALVLAATALAQGREIVVSRGELVEIGDGFRLPDLLQSTGARLREVGTTNRTAFADYADAVSDRTGFVLKIHPSNFTMHGFTGSVPVSELARLDVPVIGDVGSGLLEPLAELPGEPDVRSWLAAGATLVTASGDKLLGGPQAGLVFGAAAAIRTLRRHPFYRALRPDKLTLAALEATVAGPAPPVRAALTADPQALRQRAERAASALQMRGADARVCRSDGLVGGGGAPGTTLPGWAVELPEAYAAALRTGRPSVIARVARGRCLLDLRCVPPADDQHVVAAVTAVHRAGDRCT